MSIVVCGESEAALRELCAGARHRNAGEVILIALSDRNCLEGIADTIWRIDVPSERMIEDADRTIASLLDEERPEAVFVEATVRMQLMMGRVCARNGYSVLANVVGVDDIGIDTMYYGGLAIRVFESSSAPAVLFLRRGCFSECVPSGGETVIPVEFIDEDHGIRRKGSIPLEKGGCDLTAAKRVVDVGRGLADEGDLVMMGALCKLLGAELGCSRSLFETEHWFSKDALIGLSGSTLSSELCISIGVSGQAQHVFGIDSSKTIVAINKDRKAPIFDHADYGIAGDLYEVVPKMIEYLEAMEG